MPNGLLADVLARLAAGDVSDWRGLPPGLAWRKAAMPDEVPEAAMLGDDCEPADLLRIAEPSAGATGRVWLRDDVVVLVDVPVATERVPSEMLDLLGEPDRRLDLHYGLLPMPGGEWVYASRGLTLVVASDGTRVVHALGFAPCSANEYERRLRVGFATARRPLASRGKENES